MGTAGMMYLSVRVPRGGVGVVRSVSSSGALLQLGQGRPSRIDLILGAIARPVIQICPTLPTQSLAVCSTMNPQRHVESNCISQSVYERHLSDTRIDDEDLVLIFDRL